MTNCFFSCEITWLAPSAIAAGAASNNSFPIYFLPGTDGREGARHSTSTRIVDDAGIASPAFVFPCRVDKLFEIVFRLPVQQVFGLAIVHPVGMELARYLD